MVENFRRPFQKKCLLSQTTLFVLPKYRCKAPDRFEGQFHEAVEKKDLRRTIFDLCRHLQHSERYPIEI